MFCKYYNSSYVNHLVARAKPTEKNEDIGIKHCKAALTALSPLSLSLTKQ